MSTTASSLLNRDCVETSKSHNDGLFDPKPSISETVAVNVLSQPSTVCREEEILEAERKARKNARRSSVFLNLISLYASFKVFGLYLISINGIIGCLLTIGATIYAYFASRHKYPLWDGSMDWVLLSFVLITPMSASIQMAFRRREQALGGLARFRNCSYQLYLAHSCWEWPGRSNGGDWLTHSDKALHQLIHMGDDLYRFLSLPNTHRVWHRVTTLGQKEAANTMHVSHRLFDSLIVHRLSKLTLMTEVLKNAGLPGNEASRMRQWEQMLGQAIEDLRMLKTYRTPQALRAFARVFTIFLPPFYAPYYAELAYKTSSLTFGIFFGIITSLALSALFESIRVLEDPFAASLVLDGIDVHEELAVIQYYQLINTRKNIFPRAKEFEDPLAKENFRRESIYKLGQGNKDILFAFSI